MCWSTASVSRAPSSTSPCSSFTTPSEQVARGAGPYFYLPKLENHLEARLWNEIFVMAQQELGLPQGTIKATVLIETILAAFEMDEILYELREHSAGLNAGRWDYIFSCIKKFKRDRNFCLADRARVTMQVPFMQGVRPAAAQDLPPSRGAGHQRHERPDPGQAQSRDPRDGDRGGGNRQAPRRGGWLRWRLGGPSLAWSRWR